MLIGSQAHVMGLYDPPKDHESRVLYHELYLLIKLNSVPRSKVKE